MSDRLTPEREAEIAKRADAASRGLWGSHRDLNGAYTIQARPRTTRYGMENDGDIATLAADRTDAESYANARFIAHAREDVPALLAELAAVRAERDQARARIAEHMHEAACPVAEIQMRMLGCPGFEGNPVAPDLCAGCHEPRENHEALTTNPGPKEAAS
ncbi:hypothetical protein KYY02_17130 [Streptomyces pimonensis]|uniref:Uncharacterized protein n=1 Tax=Streptomyces pimonensis TaxID=2860288 RepID=A0ABV4J0A2_9ACTN